MKRKTPQEKKALSYANDRRNTYGESDKGSRKSIRLNKIFPNRAYRKNVNNILQESVGEVDLEKAEVVETKVKETKRKKWKKYPDQPLGEIIKQQLEIGEKPIRRKFNGTMKNVSKKDLTEYVQTKKGWWTEKR